MCHIICRNLITKNYFLKFITKRKFISFSKKKKKYLWNDNKIYFWKIYLFLEKDFIFTIRNSLKKLICFFLIDTLKIWVFLRHFIHLYSNKILLKYNGNNETVCRLFVTSNNVSKTFFSYVRNTYKDIDDKLWNWRDTFSNLLLRHTKFS